MSIDETNIAPVPSASLLQPTQGENLALAYQEVLTVITRLRTNRQSVSDSGAFRSSMKDALATAEGEAARKGYTQDDARLATFAVVTFLDESVEKVNNPLFADWHRMPLQQELFGERATGEIFFQCIDRLLARSDAAPDADLLEIFALCLLLGYRGRYGVSGVEGVSLVITAITEKVQRIRGARPIAPDCMPPADAPLHPQPDPWVRALVLGSVGALFLAVLFYVGFKVALLSGSSALHSIGLLGPK